MKKYVATPIATFLLAGCTADTKSPPTVDNKLTATLSAEVDLANHTVVLPLDKYLFTDTEDGVNSSAIYLEHAPCMSEAGMPAMWVERSEVVDTHESARYGRWDPELAATLGYADSEFSSNKGTENEFFAKHAEVVNSEAYDEAEAACLESAKTIKSLHPVLQQLPSEVTALQDSAINQLLEREDAQAVIDEWVACLTEAGLERKFGEEGGWNVVKGANFVEPDEASIKVAIADVKCKEQTQFVPRLAAIEAEIQSPVVQKYTTDLAQVRSEIDEILAASQEFIKQNASAFKNAQK